VYTESLITLLDESWVEESLWSHESWGVDRDDLTIWELVVLGKLGALVSLGLVSLWVKRDEASLLLDSNNDLIPGGLTTLSGNTISSQEVDHMVSDSSTGNVVLLDGVRNGETLENWDGMGNTITRIGNHMVNLLTADGISAQGGESAWN
jgi:hypothetical protein